MRKSSEKDVHHINFSPRTAKSFFSLEIPAKIIEVQFDAWGAEIYVFIISRRH